MKKFLKNKYVISVLILYILSIIGIWSVSKFVDLSFWNSTKKINPSKGNHFIQIISTNIISMNRNILYSFFTGSIFNLINFLINFLNTTRAFQILSLHQNYHQMYLLLNHGFVEWFAIVYEVIFIYYIIIEFLLLIIKIIQMNFKKIYMLIYLKNIAINYIALCALYLVSDILETFV